MSNKEIYKNKYNENKQKGNIKYKRNRSKDRNINKDYIYNHKDSTSIDTLANDALLSILNQIDHSTYSNYKNLKNKYILTFPIKNDLKNDFKNDLKNDNELIHYNDSTIPNSITYTLEFNWIQPDPYAPPSSLHIELDTINNGFPFEIYQTKIQRIALADYLARQFYNHIKLSNLKEISGKSGIKGGTIQMEVPSQHVLERTSVMIHKNGCIEIRFRLHLPAKGRTITSRILKEVLFTILPDIIIKSFMMHFQDMNSVLQHIHSIEDQEILRNSLYAAELVGFVRNGAILPRETGDTDTPLLDNPIRFQSPKSLEVEFTLKYNGTIRGMGIKKGITLIVGGGFHGKTTLLKALEVGIYNHIPGDEREFVVCDKNSIKIKAEESRCIKSCNISNFINNLPFKKDTTNFTTQDASGSTSQAANIMEYLEMGATTLLLDEDTCATNFMVRDKKMEKLVKNNKEPITPFISKIRPLYETKNVSVILVIGGIGDFFHVADHVIMMESFLPLDVTKEARNIMYDEISKGTYPVTSTKFESATTRFVHMSTLHPFDKINVRSKYLVSYGNTDLDLSSVEQIVEIGQTRFICEIMLKKMAEIVDSTKSIKILLDDVDKYLDHNSLSSLGEPKKYGDLSRARKFEIGAALNRLRSVEIRQ